MTDSDKIMLPQLLKNKLHDKAGKKNGCNRAGAERTSEYDADNNEENVQPYAHIARLPVIPVSQGEVQCLIGTAAEIRIGIQRGTACHNQDSQNHQAEIQPRDSEVPQERFYQIKEKAVDDLIDQRTPADLFSVIEKAECNHQHV